VFQEGELATGHGGSGVEEQAQATSAGDVAAGDKEGRLVTAATGWEAGSSVTGSRGKGGGL